MKMQVPLGGPPRCQNRHALTKKREKRGKAMTLEAEALHAPSSFTKQKGTAKKLNLQPTTFASSQIYTASAYCSLITLVVIVIVSISQTTSNNNINNEVLFPPHRNTLIHRFSLHHGLCTIRHHQIFHFHRCCLRLCPKCRGRRSHHKRY